MCEQEFFFLLSEIFFSPVEQEKKYSGDKGVEMLPEGGGAMSMEQVVQTLDELESSHWSSKDPESVIRAKMSQARETISSLQAEVADLRRKLEISGRKRGLSVAQSTALSGFFTGLFR